MSLPCPSSISAHPIKSTNFPEEPEISLVGPAAESYVIDGTYSALLQGFGEEATLSQTGLIPTGTQSLIFEAQSHGGPLAVSVGGQNVSLVPIGVGANYTEYAANISAWAGDNETLAFSADPAPGNSSVWAIDDISFSPQAVPEPNTLELMVVGGMTLGLHGWRKRHNASRR